MKSGFIKTFIARLIAAVRRHPMEVLLSVCLSVLGCLYFEYQWKEVEDVFFYFPVWFLITYMLNTLFLNGKLRVLYYLSVVCCVPFVWIEAETPSVIWGVSLIVIQLLYFISFRLRDNDAFMERVLCYVRSAVSAGALAFVTWLLSISIYYSVRYIFEIWEHSENRFMADIASIVGFAVLPLLFMMFNEDQRFGKGFRIVEVLFNYVLSPALLIYAVILYTYFIKIAITWSLPKGGIAYIVVSFTAVVFLLRGCRPFLQKSYYDWFYSRASWVVIPALIMYWVGCCYRINQYGFTEPRVYLVVAGLILTGMALLFLSERWGRYLYAACLAVVLLSAITYIPGIRAVDIERVSQAGRPHTVDETPLFRSEYIEIENKDVIDIVGYSTMRRVESYRWQKGMWLKTTSDSLYVYKPEDELIYAESLSGILEQQLLQARINELTGNDTIPQAVYPDLLRLELPSGMLVFDRISMVRDSVYTISYFGGGYYFERQTMVNGGSN